MARNEEQTAAKKSRAAYQREYRRRNPEKCAQWSINYWTRRAVREGLIAADSVEIAANKKGEAGQ